jgi:hypothetical protein
MERTMQRFIPSYRALLASILVALLLAGGCSNERPIQPLGSDQNAAENAASSLSKRGNGSRSSNTSLSSASNDKRVKRKNPLEQNNLQTVSQIIKANAGGSVKSNDFEISIPSDALDNDAAISITPTSDLYLQGDFGPDGTQFNPPATLSISYENADLEGITPANLSISWFDPAQGKWIDLGGKLNEKEKIVSVQVRHFTQYTLSMR